MKNWNIWIGLVYFAAIYYYVFICLAWNLALFMFLCHCVSSIFDGSHQMFGVFHWCSCFLFWAGGFSVWFLFFGFLVSWFPKNEQNYQCKMKGLAPRYCNTVPSGNLTGRTEGCPGMVVWTSVGSSFLCTGAVFFDSGTSVSSRGLRRIFGKISQKSEPSADFTRFGHFHFFNLFHFLATPDLIIYVSPHETPHRSMRICSMGPGDFITYVNLNETPNRSMRICSMGPGDFITYVNPKWNP